MTSSALIPLSDSDTATAPAGDGDGVLDWEYTQDDVEVGEAVDVPLPVGLLLVDAWELGLGLAVEVVVGNDDAEEAADNVAAAV